MNKLLVFFLFVVSFGYGQVRGTLKINFAEVCDRNFSKEQLDSTFCNFYIQDYKDTVYFRQASCIEEAQISSPVTFKRRIQKGYANGFLRTYSRSDGSYSWEDGNYKNGFITDGSYLEYYLNGELKLTGQYAYGHRNGVWTWYFEDGKINRLVVYEIAEPVKIMEYDGDGNLIEDYDFVTEKAKAGQ